MAGFYTMCRGNSTFYKHEGFTTTITAQFTKDYHATNREITYYESCMYTIGNDEYVTKHTGFVTVVNTNQSAGGDYGIAFWGGNMYTAKNGARTIRKFNGFSTTILDTFDGVGNVYGITFQSGNVIQNDFATDNTTKFDGFSSTILTSYVYSVAITNYGIDFHGNKTYVCEQVSTHIARYDGFPTTSSEATLTAAGSDVVGCSWEHLLVDEVVPYGGVDFGIFCFDLNAKLGF